MISKEFLGVIAAIIGFVGYGPYLFSVWQGKTRPHAFSWIVWSLIDSVAFLAQLSRGAGPGAWATGAGMVVCFVVALCGIVRGERNITRGDWIAFISALAAILPWYLTKNPLWSVIWVAMINTVAYYPTIRKSWCKPCEENLWPYASDIPKYGLALFALNSYSATTVITPLSVVIGNSIFVSLNLWRRAVMARVTK